MRRITLLLPALFALLPCCGVAESPEQEAAPVLRETTIHAAVPSDNATRITLTPSGTGLHLAWEDGDCLRVFAGSTSGRYDIKEGFTDHEADFTGPELSGTTYDIMYPGTFETVEDAEATDFSYQTQNGNGSTDHLRYAVLLSGVDDYSSIVFNEEWATAHGGTIKKAGAIRIAVTLPDGVTTLSKAELDLAGRKLSLALKNINVSKDAQVLTAYLMTPWEDIVLPANSKVEVRVQAADGATYGTTVTLADGATLRAGRVSNMNFTKNIKEIPFDGGTGTAGDPWLVANARQLENMMNLYKDTEEADFMWYFKQTADIDASKIDWVSLNRASPYKKGVDYDGDGHTISGLTSGSDYNYPSFAGVLYGSVRNVTFTGASISAGNNKCGVVAGYIGTTGVVGNCSGVTVMNSTVDGTNNMGGFAGQVACAGTISDCHVIDVTVSQGYTSTGRSTGGFTGYVSADPTFIGCSFKGSVTGRANTGGFAGYAEKATFGDCIVEDATVIDAHSGKNARSGGFVGYVALGVNLTGNIVRNTTVSGTGAQRIGGFVGQLGSQSTGKNADLVKDCSVVDCTISGAALSGGFVGVQYNDLEKCCVSGGSVTLGGAQCGGFSGFAQNGNILNCYTSADVSAGANSPVGGMVGITYAVTIYNSYASGSFSCSGANVGALIGQTEVTYDSNNIPNCYPASVSGCIGWNSSLPAIGSNTVGATVSNCYVGTAGTVSSQASALGWNTGIWNLSASEPTLKPGSAASEGVSVVFIGDSITWQWTRSGFHPEYFIDNGYVNKGISGEKTGEMLARYDYDILALHPKVVVIMGGTNDIANSITQEQIMANLQSMAEKAVAIGARVVLCSVTPCNRHYSAVGGPKTLAILPLNEAIKAYADAQGHPYCNYYPVLADPDDGLKSEYMKDGTDDLHPNRAGYIAMEAVIQPILENLLNN